MKTIIFFISFIFTLSLHAQLVPSLQMGCFTNETDNYIQIIANYNIIEDNAIIASNFLVTDPSVAYNIRNNDIVFAVGVLTNQDGEQAFSPLSISHIDFPSIAFPETEFLKFQSGESYQIVLSFNNPTSNIIELRCKAGSFNDGEYLTLDPLSCVNMRVSMLPADHAYLELEVITSQINEANILVNIHKQLDLRTFYSISD